MWLVGQVCLGMRHAFMACRDGTSCVTPFYADEILLACYCTIQPQATDQACTATPFCTCCPDMFDTAFPQ